MPARAHPTHLDAVLCPVMALAPSALLVEQFDAPFADAVRDHDTATLFEWLVTSIQYQGIANRIATSFIARSRPVTYTGMIRSLQSGDLCPKLTSYWAFADCGYRKAAGTCGCPDRLARCPLPQIALRNGRLSQAAYSLYLFIRDVCDGDLVAWIDRRLDYADRGHGRARADAMRWALLDPMLNIFGLSDKVLSMSMSGLLLSAGPGRERWLTVGGSMIAVDSLVHNFLHRTGVLRAADAEHAYGPACYAAGACADLIAGYAERIDASVRDARYPAYFPRLIQHAIWHFCAEPGRNICNGRQIDDRLPCGNQFCPVSRACARVALNPT